VRIEVEAESKPAPESRHFTGRRDVTRLHGGVALREGRVDASEPRALVWAERAGNTRFARRQRGVARPQVDAQIDVQTASGRSERQLPSPLGQASRQLRVTHGRSEGARGTHTTVRSQTQPHS
jgi:hypothetical protein